VIPRDPQDRKGQSRKDGGPEGVRQGWYNPNGTGTGPLPVLDDSSRGQSDTGKYRQKKHLPLRHSRETTTTAIRFPLLGTSDHVSSDRKCHVTIGAHRERTAANDVPT
jgi:hypothetical protein